MCSNGRRYENDLICFKDSEITPHFSVGERPQRLLFLSCFRLQQNNIFLGWKLRLQHCLANLRALLASQGPLGWMFVRACHRHCNRQDFTLTFSAECISFQSDTTWAAVLCWCLFSIFQPVLESGSWMHSELLTSVYFQFSSRNFSWGLCLLA